jgi:glyoxalase family protein
VMTVAFAVPAGSLDFWERRLKELGVEASRQRRFDTDAIALKDPDGILIELVGEASDGRWAPWPDSPVGEADQIRGFHSVGLCVREEAPTAGFLASVMGFREVGREPGRVRYATGEGGPDSILELMVRPEAPIGEETTGTVHHVAWRALDDPHQLDWRQTLVEAGRDVTPVIERKYFRSIYFREPGGVLFEIATDGPGFMVDEPVEALGSGLRLPPRYEDKRENLDFKLPPIVVPKFAGARPER